MAQTLDSQVRGLWWLVLIRGVLFVLLGIAALLQPAVAVVAFTLVFGIYAIVDGVMVIIAAIAARKDYSGWGWLVVQGILTVIAGVLIVSLPAAAGLVGVFALLWFLAISAFVGGIMQLVAAARTKGGAKGWNIVGGIIDIIFGILIAVLAITSPAGAVLATVWVVAIGAIILGVVLIVAAFRVKRGDLRVIEEEVPAGVV
ncbi:MAG TPA: DUF308 domain-containing protein [Microbacteriaceae bacterium]|nr:DUF308 domain-containing protein [Microbacteriaceae bacterium]